MSFEILFPFGLWVSEPGWLLNINPERLLNMIINLLEAGSVLHLVPNDEDQTTYGEIWHNLDRFLSNAGIGRDAGRHGFGENESKRC